MGQTAISCTDRKLPGSLPELRLTHPLNHVKNPSNNKPCGCWRRPSALCPWYFYHVDQLQKFRVKELVERLSQSIRWHIRAGSVAERHVSFLILLSRVFVVDVNVLCAFVVTIFSDHVESRFVVCLKVERAEVVTNISELAE